MNENNQLHSVLALFRNPQELIRAVQYVSLNGYTCFDVHTPYPVRGLSKAMRPTSDKLPLIAFCFGMFGILAALGFQWFLSAINYAVPIGGRSFTPFLMWIPVIFECGVLFSALALVIAFIGRSTRLPNTAHPLHGTDYMRRVSCDRFGMMIEAQDPLFDEVRVRRSLDSLGAESIVTFYALIPNSKPIFSWWLTATVLVASIITAALTISLNHILPNLPPFNWMTTQYRLQPQSPALEFPDGSSSRPPPEGTVARGLSPYLYPGQIERAEKELNNPVQASPSVLNDGKRGFRAFCSPCHGNLGLSDSRLRLQFPIPPSLHSQRARDFKDGRIFHLITEGQNTMPSHAKQIPIEERWKIVHYLRVLQHSQETKEPPPR